MKGHTIIGGDARLTDLWDRNPQCRCGNTWRCHWAKRAGGPCDVTNCCCEAFVAAAPVQAGGEGE